MNPIVIIVTVVGEGGNGGVVRRSLQVIPVLGARQDWIGDDVFCDVQLKATYQREDTAHVTLVDVDFLKPHV